MADDSRPAFSAPKTVPVVTSFSHLNGRESKRLLSFFLMNHQFSRTFRSAGRTLSSTRHTSYAVPSSLNFYYTRAVSSVTPPRSTTKMATRIHRVTMFKLPKAEDQNALMEQYKKLNAENSKVMRKQPVFGLAPRCPPHYGNNAAGRKLDLLHRLLTELFHHRMASRTF
jgi:hypothetical protein